MKWVKCSEKLPIVGEKVVVTGTSCTRYSVFRLQRVDSFKMKGYIWLDEDDETQEMYETDYWLKLPYLNKLA